MKVPNWKLEADLVQFRHAADKVLFGGWNVLKRLVIFGSMYKYVGKCPHFKIFLACTFELYRNSQREDLWHQADFHAWKYTHLGLLLLSTP